MQRRLLLEISAMLALSVNYAGAYILAIIWNWPSPETELYVHLVALFIVSFLFGALIVNIQRTLIYTIVSIVIGMALAAFFVSLPSVMLGEAYEAVDLSLTVALAVLSRLFVVGAMFQLIGPLFGCFLGDLLFQEESL
jgi:presenilin-like A22 family membrane protease